MAFITILSIAVATAALIGMTNWAPRNKRLQIDLTRKAREKKKAKKAGLDKNKQKSVPKPKISDDWVCIGKLDKIIIYPIDDGYGLTENRAHCTRHGLATDTSVHWRGYRYKENDSMRGFHDRTVMAFEKSGRRVVIRNPNVDLLDDPELHTLINLQLETQLYSLERVPRIVYENQTSSFIVYDLGDGVASLLGNIWTTGLRLGYRQRDCRTTYNASMRKFFRNHPRKPEWTLDGFSANFSTYSLVNTQHIKELQEKSERDDISFWNFRPNIVVSSNGTTYLEENVVAVKIGNVEFSNIIPCSHTSSINNDISRPEEIDHEEPYNYLSTHRRLCDVHPELSSTLTSPIFGLNMELLIRYTKKGQRIHTAPGEIRLKDPVYVKLKKIIPNSPRPGPSILKKPKENGEALFEIL